MLVITRQEAIAKGLKNYFTGKACLRGHVSIRNVSDKTCKTCAASSRRANMQRYITGEVITYESVTKPEDNNINRLLMGPLV